MENNKNIKKWNKEAIWSLISLTLLIIVILSNPFFGINLPYSFTSKLDFYMYWYFNWWRASDSLFYIPTLLMILLSFINIYLGVKSIKKIQTRHEKGRILGLISATVGLLLPLIMVTLLLYF